MTFSDSRIAKMLKEDFIPVWEAVSPVRTVTFDLGEGRKIKGSVSGEIAIYFCNPKGKVFDILPALQSPAATLNAMKTAKDFHAKLAKIKTTDSASSYLEYKDLIRNFHKKRMKILAANKYDALLKAGTEILKNPEKFPARFIFPQSAVGESKRVKYINAATDDATRDLRRMTMSKSGSMPTLNQRTYTENALTVIEPGGRGYYLWKIGQVMHGVFPQGYYDRRLSIPVTPTELKKMLTPPPPLMTPTELKKMLTPPPLMTPTEWKKTLFEGIFKQELKGGEVEYNSDSLEAINVFEE